MIRRCSSIGILAGRSLSRRVLHKYTIDSVALEDGLFGYVDSNWWAARSFDHDCFFYW